MHQISADSVAAVAADVLAAPAYDWTIRRSAWAWVGDVIGSFVRWFDRLGTEHPIAFLVLLLALTAVLIALLVHIGYVLWLSLHPTRREAGIAAPGPRALHGAAWHLAESARCAAAGRFADALGHRFLALVLELDRRHTLKAHPSKTPAEYVREARLDADGGRDFAQLVDVLHSHLYGGRACGPDDWARFDGAAGRLA